MVYISYIYTHVLSMITYLPGILTEKGKKTNNLSPLPPIGESGGKFMQDQGQGSIFDPGW